jgi:hypothetical protein
MSLSDLPMNLKWKGRGVDVNRTRGGRMGTSAGAGAFMPDSGDSCLCSNFAKMGEGSDS